MDSITRLKTQLTGRWRRQAIQTLIRDGSPAAVRLLSETVAAAADPSVGAALLTAIRPLAKLGSPIAQDAVCRLFLDHDFAPARELALAQGYVPRSDPDRALFYFLTGRDADYQALDFDHALLRAAVAAGSAKLRRRVASRAQAGTYLFPAGYWDLVIGHSRPARGVTELTESDWAALIPLLAHRRSWDDLWALARQGPPAWSARIITTLTNSGWQPGPGIPRECFQRLARALPAPDEAGPDLTSLLGECHAIPGRTAATQSLSVTPDSRILIGGRTDGTICFRSLPDGATISRLEGHRERVTCLAVILQGHDPNCRNSGSCPDLALASGSADRTIRVWTLPGGKLHCTIYGHESQVTSLAVSPDGRTLAAGGWDGTIRSWALPEFKPQPVLRAHDAPVASLVFAPDRRTLISGSPDRTIRLWRIGGHDPNCHSSGSCPPTANCRNSGSSPRTALHLHRDAITALAVTPDGRVLVSASADGAIRLWRLPGGEPLGGHDPNCRSSGSCPPTPVNCLAISADGSMLFSAGRDRAIRLWRLPGGEFIRELADHGDAISSLALTPDQETLCAAEEGRALRLWNLRPLRFPAIPVQSMTGLDLKWIDNALADPRLTGRNRQWLGFIRVLVELHLECDIRLEPGRREIVADDYDVELR